MSNNRNNKKRIIKDYDSLPEDILTRIKMQYPRGFAQSLVSYINKDGKKVSALPFETEDIYYLVRMTIQEAKQIIEDDEDYDDDGILRDDFSADVSTGDTATFDEDEAYFHNEASTIEYADADFNDASLKDNIFQGSEFADTDIDSIDFDADDTDDDDDDDEDSDDADSDLDFDDDDEDEDDAPKSKKPSKTTPKKGKK